MAERTESRSNRTAGDGVRDRLAGARTSVFSLRAFLLALAFTAAGAFVGGAIPVVGPLGGLAGVLGGGFALGLVAGERRYAEAAVAGAVAAGVGTLFDFLVLSIVGVGLPLAALGGGSGAVAAAVGHYLGRDLRAGLTRDL